MPTSLWKKFRNELLYNAAIKGSPMFVRLFIAVVAAREGHEEIVAQLIADRANINARSGNSDTALILAALEGHEKIVERLIADGADIDARDENNDTALIVAAWQGREEVVERLIAAGADVDAKNENGDTALIIATDKWRAEVVKHLIADGADIYVENSKGQTALNFVQRNRHNEIIDQIILQHINNQTGHKYDSLRDVWGLLSSQPGVAVRGLFKFNIVGTLRQTISDLELTDKSKAEFITALRKVTTLAKRPWRTRENSTPRCF